MSQIKWILLIILGFIPVVFATVVLTINEGTNVSRNVTGFSKVYSLFMPDWNEITANGKKCKFRREFGQNVEQCEKVKINQDDRF